MEKIKIAILGLGYVGLPLALAFSEKYSVIGFDIKNHRIEELKKGKDSTREVDESELAAAKNLKFSSNEEDLKEANVLIVTVPTPIDDHRQPDLTPLIKASELLGRVIKKGDVVIYESTVYPGATEEDCIPVIEQVSGLTFNHDFYAGYSPERINPGDKERPVTKIMKVTSGSTPEVAEFVDQLYKSIIEAGTYKASSIKVAEASKIIENTQRDVNIALINELSMIFSHLNINTHDVIEAAATKWNFIKLQPGLVGGHCIGVDPYYLMHKSMAVGYIPDIIRTSREINDGMPKFIASKIIKEMIIRKKTIHESKTLILGVTFKENCADIRNTKVVDLIKELLSYSMSIDIYDPLANSEEFQSEYGLSLIEKPKESYYDLLIIPVAHNEFNEKEIVKYANKNSLYLDIKNIISNNVTGKITL